MTGTESFFVRTSGCNLRCWFCDTPYASWNPNGTAISIETLVEAAIASRCHHVVLTGGEPLLPKEATHLCQSLRAAGFHLTIETAGTIDRTVECDLMSISPKLRSSVPDATKHPRWSQRHNERRMPLSVMRSLIQRSKDHQLKFVVDSPSDYDELLEIVAALDAQQRRRMDHASR